MAQEESKSFGNVIAETAIATLFWLIVGFALLASLFPVLFPAASARFYADLGNVPRAYDCAARAADTDGTVESRQKAVAYAVSLYDETGKTYGVLKSVPAFLKESGETFAEIDRKNIAALDKIYHPSVYSYRDYLAGVLAKVRTKEGKTYVFDGNDFVAGKIALASSPTSGSSSLVLVQVAEALKSGFVADSIAVNYGTADELISFAKAYVLLPREGLSQVYAALVYARFIKALDDKFALTDSQKSATEIEYNGSVLTPSKYYDELLVGYVK